MHHADERGRRWRAIRPALERIEARQLPSGILSAPLARHLPGVHTRAAATSGASAGTPDQATSPRPTAHQAALQKFNAFYQGEYTVGPGRSAGQRQLIFFLGFGNSNTMHHTGLKIALNVPADPTAPITGQAMLEDRNISSTGNFLGLDLQANPQAPLFHGLPTQLTWTVGGNNGGLFVDAVGQGTLQLRYTPGGRLPQRATGAGNFGAIFKGTVAASRVFGVNGPF